MAPELALPAHGRHSAFRRGPWAAVCVTAALLIALGVERQTRGATKQSTTYHERMRVLAESTVPFSIGDWLGRTVEPPKAALAILHTNQYLSRVYENLRTGEVATLLYVQCSDARDLIGHYPPICYRGRGLLEKSRAPTDWAIGETKIEGMRYRFGGERPTGSYETVVDNFMALPTGTTGRDMDSVNEVAQDTRLRHFGAAQIQVVTDGAMTDARRDEVFRTLVGRMVPVLESMKAETESE